VGISLERGADLHMAQLMPLPLTVSCFSKIQIGFTFLVPAHPGSPGQKAVKRMCVCFFLSKNIQLGLADPNNVPGPVCTEPIPLLDATRCALVETTRGRATVRLGKLTC